MRQFKKKGLVADKILPYLSLSINDLLVYRKAYRVSKDEWSYLPSPYPRLGFYLRPQNEYKIFEDVSLQRLSQLRDWPQ